ncbi:MAG TPA: glycoside hydrolase family 28 protein [Terriglobia bacterium]|nr:glycoside hydrolase family 28 protein [Terriglobia bacterium]
MLRRHFLFNSGAAGLAANMGLPASSGGAVLQNTVYNVLAYGASADGRKMDTQAIQAAIDACAEKGGGTVFLPAGKYLTGAIKLKSNIDLHLGSGATLLGSQDPGDYPVYPSPWPGGSREISSLIYGDGLTNVSLTGRGIIDGQGQAWWTRQWLMFPKRSAPVPVMSEEERRAEVAKISNGRPRLMTLLNCRNVLIEGLTLINSAFWTVHPMFCDGVTITELTILNPVPSPNTDGIDPESCRNVHISDCHIDVGDDCIAIKSGKDAGGRKVGKPCENITITNLTTGHGHGVSIGSEMSGGVRNVTITNCVFQGMDRGIRIKTQRGRGGVVEGVTAANIVMQDVPEPFALTCFYSRGNPDEARPVDEGTPKFRDFHFAHITARGARSAGQITGLREMPISGVVFNDIRIEAQRGFTCQNARELAFHNVYIESTRGPALAAKTVEAVEFDGFSGKASGAPLMTLEDAKGVFVRGCSASAGTSAFLEVSGAASSNIVLRSNNLSRAAKSVMFGAGAGPAILSEE